MYRFLKTYLGRTVLVQSHGFAMRGRLVGVRDDVVELADVKILDEEGRASEWADMDGCVVIPMAQVRFMQVA